VATYQGSASVTVEDTYGIPAQTQMTITVADTTTVAQLATWASDLQGLIGDGNLSQGKTTKTEVRLVFGVGTDTTTPAGDVEKGGLFNFGNATDSFLQGILVPDINPSVLNANGLIDLSNTTVTDFITFITTVTTGITVVTKGLRALASLVDALITFRKHRKPLTRKTKEIG